MLSGLPRNSPQGVLLGFASGRQRYSKTHDTLVPLLNSCASTANDDKIVQEDAANNLDLNLRSVFSQLRYPNYQLELSRQGFRACCSGLAGRCSESLAKKFNWVRLDGGKPEKVL